jgi:hypothetical protein
MNRVLWISELETKNTVYCYAHNAGYRAIAAGQIECNQTLRFCPGGPKCILLKNRPVSVDYSRELGPDFISIMNAEELVHRTVRTMAPALHP